MMTRASWLILALAVLAAVAGGWLQHASRVRRGADLVGQPAPAMRLPDLDGREHALSDYAGRRVLVNFWATWCGPCRKEMPSLAELEHKLGSEDFEVVAISLDRKGAEAAAPFLMETGAADLALYLDPTAASLDQLRAMGLPASVLIDRQGNEIGRMLGPAEWSSPEAIALVKAALAEKTG